MTYYIAAYDTEMWNVSRFEARVVWGQLLESHYLCGIQFTTLSEDPADPLRALMDSVF